MDRDSRTYPLAGIALSLFLLAFTGTGHAVEADYADEVARFGVRSPKREIPVERVSDKSECRAKPVVVGEEANPELRISCEKGEKIDWSKVDAHTVLMHRSTQGEHKTMLKLTVGGEAYLARDMYFRIENTTPRRLPPCSLMKDRPPNMGATQGSRRGGCDPTR